MKSHDQFNGNLLKTYSDCQSFLFFKSVKYASSASYPYCLLHMIGIFFIPQSTGTTFISQSIVIFFIPQSIVVLFLLAPVAAITNQPLWWKPARLIKKRYPILQDRMVLDSAVQNSGTHKVPPEYSRLIQAYPNTLMLLNLWLWSGSGMTKHIRSENWHGKQIGTLNADSPDFLVKYSGMVMLVFRITDYNITI